jgi:hypothetical protein
LAHGVVLLYRRSRTNGACVLKASDGSGSYWTKRIADADDYADSDGKNVLTFYEAQDAAKKLARGEDGSADAAPITLDGALTAYAADLKARSANPYNAEWARVHLPSVVLSKPTLLCSRHQAFDRELPMPQGGFLRGQRHNVIGRIEQGAQWLGLASTIGSSNSRDHRNSALQLR